MAVRQELLERITGRISHSQTGEKWAVFSSRLDAYFDDLFTYLKILYGDRDDFLYFLEDLLSDIWVGFLERPEELVVRDQEHNSESQWFTSNEIVGGVCYVDLFAGDIKKLIDKLDYIEEIGINFLHLMPMFQVPEHESDGGYAVSSYRDLDSKLGSMEDLRLLAKRMHERGISLVVDFILNHTSDQHIWAERAKEGDTYYRNFYYIFPDRMESDEYQQHLRDIFPEVRKGSFTYSNELGAWVWTTFNSFQWDLNYHNHQVFRAMAKEMVFLANVGVDVFRYDAIAFIWKKKGTRCESLPEAHTLVRAFRALARIAAPAVVFKSEAIVHPDEVLTYVDHDECELSYNPLLMATSWEALATRDPRLLAKSIETKYKLNFGCAWVNYVRCHDDIGWTFDDRDAWSLGINPQGHRSFLNSYFIGKFPGSFSRGLPFQENKISGDCRVSGTCASLAGLEKGILQQDFTELEFAANRMELLYGLAFTLGGIPLIYLGDELGPCNDYFFLEKRGKAHDSRWVHRVPFDEQAYNRRTEDETMEQKFYFLMRRLVDIRKSNSVFAVGDTFIH
ncbi:MAG: alpha-amylase family protein [Spirochaetales bacterium]|jgi:amylosucrase|nr:alpha-amylase family protein [Spirochaetales bacterium]